MISRADGNSGRATSTPTAFATGIEGFGTWEWDVVAKRLTWSEDLRRLYGADRPPAHDSDFLSMVHPDDRARASAEAASYMAAGDAFEHEFRIVTASGQIRHILDRGVIHRAPDGRPVRLVGVSVDVTALRERGAAADHAAQVSRIAALLQVARDQSGGLGTMLDSLPVGVMLAEPSGLATFQNLALRNFWRGARHLETFADWSRYVAWAADTGEPIQAEDWPLARALATGQEQTEREIRFQRFDGSIGFMLVSAVPVRNSEGQIIAGIAVAHDISARKAAEEDARLGRELLQRIGESTPDLIYAKDREGRMTFANPAVLKTVGKAWEQIAGRNEGEWHDRREEALAIMQADQRVMAGGEPVRIEEIFTGADGEDVFLSTKNPLFGEKGEVIGLIGISTNITPLKRAEAQTRMLMQELNHRVKNVLSLVQSMARQTLKSAGVAPVAWNTFESRLVALSRSQDILLSDQWTGAEVDRIVRDSLSAVASDSDIVIEGPAAWLEAQAAVALALSIHELCTNAVKYGALSAAGGTIRVAWTPTSAPDGEALDFTWVESGGPEVRRPSRRGFGSRLIESAFAFQGPDRVRLDYAPSGLIMRARIGLGANRGS